MYCPRCGTNNQEGATFCENCGNRLTQPSRSSKNSNRNILLIICVVLIIGIGAAAVTYLYLTNQSVPSTTTTTQDTVTTVEKNQETSVNTQKVTSTQAANIAEDYAQSYVPGAIAGTPTLNGNTYTVPLYGNGAVVGEVLVNAQTGNVVDHWFQEQLTEADLE